MGNDDQLGAFKLITPVESKQYVFDLNWVVGDYSWIKAQSGGGSKRFAVKYSRRLAFIDYDILNYPSIGDCKSYDDIALDTLLLYFGRVIGSNQA